MKNSLPSCHARLALTVISALLAMGILVSCGHSAPPPTLLIATPSLPNGVTGVAYSQTIQAGGGVGPFIWTVGPGTLPKNLSLSSSTTNIVTISGTPDLEQQAAQFTVKISDSAGQTATQSYSISVSLGADSMVAAPSNVDFGVQLVGGPIAQEETLTNASSSALAITTVAISGVNAADFDVATNTCTGSVRSGANCTMGLTFTPSQPGPRLGVLTVTDDGVGSPQSIAITGTGLVLGANATLSATSVGFGSVVLSKTSSPMSLTLSNYGKSTLSIKSVTTSLPFAETDNCPASLTSGGTCTINLTFAPTAFGTVTGTLSITDDAPDTPQQVTLSGTGTKGWQCYPKGSQCWTGHPCCAGLGCYAAGDRSYCE